MCRWQHKIAKLLYKRLKWHWWHLKEERREPKLLGDTMVNQLLIIVPFMKLLIPLESSQWVVSTQWVVSRGWCTKLVRPAVKKLFNIEQFLTENSFNSKLKITREFGDALGYNFLECPQWVEFIEGDLDIFRPQVHRRDIEFLSRFFIIKISIKLQIMILKWKFNWVTSSHLSQLHTSDSSTTSWIEH